MSANSQAVARDLNELIRDLTELIAAIDRRLPQVRRNGEAAIANAAMRLRTEAQARIAELERDRGQSS